MILIIGLGNPEEKYKGTRHNIGREIIQAFRKDAGFPDFRIEKKWKAWVSEGRVEKNRVALLQPDTFMNKSGNAVAPATRFFKVKPKNVFVVHDDADITLGRAKLSFGKHSAGHQGIESVMRALKTRDFWRFRIGIAGKRNIPAEKLVLKKFSSIELKIVKKIAKKTMAALDIAIKEGPEKAMNTYNQ